MLFFFFKQKTAYEMRISDWSSDVCSSDLPEQEGGQDHGGKEGHEGIADRHGDFRDGANGKSDQAENGRQQISMPRPAQDKRQPLHESFVLALHISPRFLGRYSNITAEIGRAHV